MRHKIGINSFVKTDIESQAYFARQIVTEAPRSPTIPTASLQHPSGWNTVECQMQNEIEERERIWREHGIVESTVSIQESS